MGGALGLVITTDVPIEGRHAIPVYVDDTLPIVGPSRACVVTTGEVPQAGGPPIAARLAPPGTPAIGPAIPVYVVAGSLSSGPVATLPANSVLPAISGTPEVGQTLTTTDGTWTGTAPIVYTYQWKRDGVSIGGATNSTYLLVAGDLGKTITVTVTATNAAGSASATSTGVVIVNFLLRDEFTTAQAAPLTTPRTCEPGPGTLVITDTTNKVSISGDLLRWTTRTANNDPRLVTPATIARQIGLAFHAYAKDTKWQLGFDSANTRSPLVGAFVISSTAITFSVTASLNPDLLDVRAVASYYNFIVLQQSDGCYFLVKNAVGGIDYPYWTLLYFSTADATANLYAALGCSNANPSTEDTFEDLRVAPLAGGLQTDYSVATSYAASASANATAIMSANGHVVCNRQMVTNDIFELDVRRTDNNNRWCVRCAQAGSTIKLIEIVAGVETERASASQTFTNGTTYRIAARCLNFDIKTLVNDVLKNTWTTATFNSAATGVKVSHAVTKLACFPRIVTGTPADQLNALAGAFAGADPVAGSGTFAAQGYIDRVMVLAPNAYWPMQELYGTTALDSTGNARNGTFGAVDQIYPNNSGLYGTSYRYAGTLNGDVNANAALTTAFTVNEFTVAFWIKMTLQPATNPKLMESWTDPNSYYWAIECRGAGGDEIGIFMNEPDALAVTIGNIAKLANETWTHLAFFNSLSTGTTGIYLNGTLYSFAKTSVLGITGTNRAAHPYFGGGWAGYKQHLAIWNRKLSQAEIDTICT